MAISKLTDDWQGGVVSAHLASKCEKGEPIGLVDTLTNGLKDVSWFKVDLVRFANDNPRRSRPSGRRARAGPWPTLH